MKTLVSVIDDESVREALPDLLKEFGFEVQAFSSAEGFLASDCVIGTRCLVLDVEMPSMGGPDLQRELTRRQQDIPMVYTTARAGESIRPQMSDQGTSACLLKPFSSADLFGALNSALHVN